MERTVGKNEKLESLKLKNFCLSWKEPSEIGKHRSKMESFAEVGKSQAKLERTERSWKEPIEVVKIELKLESTTEVGKWLQKKLSNFAWFFPTSISSSQLRSALSNFRLSNFSFFPTALSNYTYPLFSDIKVHGIQPLYLYIKIQGAQPMHEINVEISGFLVVYS